MRFAVIILAAGASTRMGRPKLLLPWAGGTVLGDLVGRWRKLGSSRIAVVVAPGHLELNRELDHLGVGENDRILNREPQRGMFSSVQTAAAWDGWASGVTHWVLTLGDQPQVRTRTLRQLLIFAAAHPEQVCQPARSGRGRHPVVLPAPVFHRLAETRAGNLKQFLQELPEGRALMESEDDGLDFDLDEPSDYERAIRRIEQRAS